MTKKPEGFAEFDALTRKLIRVPRKELEKTMKRRKIKRRKKPQ